VRKRLGIGYEDLAFDEWWVVVDAWERAPTSFPKMNTQYCWPSRPASAITGPRNLRRWELKILPHEKPEEFHDQARVREVLMDFIEIDAIELWRSAVYRFHALVADRWRAGRVFLAGDACHQTPPFMGQGMCAGIRDAANLAWRLALVLQAGAMDPLLDSYQAERKPHVEALVGFAKKAGEVIGELDLDAARARDALLRGQLERGEAETIRQRFIPNLTGGVIDTASGPAAGTLFVQPRVGEEGDGALLDDVVAPRFLLATRSEAAQSWLSAASLDVWRRIGGERAIISQDETTARDDGILRLRERARLFADWMARHGAAAVVARPDRYVYGVARDRDGLNNLVARLAQQVFG